MATAWEGTSCFTQAESTKLVASLKKDYKIDGISGRWIHYTSWKQGRGVETETKLRELLSADESTGSEVSGKSKSLITFSISGK